MWKELLFWSEKIGVIWSGGISDVGGGSGGFDEMVREWCIVGCNVCIGGGFNCYVVLGWSVWGWMGV